ncbi:MAG: ComF family protein [Pseudomonadota bacterium]
MASTAFHAVYPPLCMGCGVETSAANGLCPSCWADTEFIYEPACTSCGAPLIGDTPGLCEDCFADPPPWDDGSAVVVYGPVTARIIQALKHGDRLDFVPRLGKWMAQTGAPLISPKAVVVPVPVHWRRLLKRKFNQADLLARQIARHHRLKYRNDVLLRTKGTQQQRSMSREERVNNQENSFCVSDPSQIVGAHILLVDDVMTTGATLRAAAKTLRSAGVKTISISVFARVAPNL